MPEPTAPVRSPARCAALIILVAWSAACSSNDGDGPASDAASIDALAPTAVDLFDNHKWTVLAGVDDPFTSLRPQADRCTQPEGYRTEVTPEENWLEIDFKFCNYLTVTQPSLRAIDAGATLTITAHHFPLTSPDGGAGEMRLMLGDDAVWQKTVPIPADREVITEDFKVEKALPAGTPIVFHLHNHGDNSWQLFSLRIK